MELQARLADFHLLTASPVTPIIGAEISGIDLSQPLSDALFEEVHRALMEYQVIFFRDQDISIEQQKSLARRFGTLHTHPAAPAHEGDTEVMMIRGDDKSKVVAGNFWHSDVSCEEEPPMGTLLHLHQVPPSGGDTLFASMYAAFEALSGPMQSFLSGLSALHGSEHVYRGRYGVKEDPARVYPTAVHPVVRTHPVTGRKGLYVNPSFTVKVRELNSRESEALLRMLYDHMAQPEFHCRFRWRKHSLAFWDNRCTQHFAMWDYYPQVRHGLRVTVKGDRPF